MQSLVTVGHCEEEAFHSGAINKDKKCTQVCVCRTQCGFARMP
jgi:hypothetical protein